MKMNMSVVTASILAMGIIAACGGADDESGDAQEQRVEGSAIRLALSSSGESGAAYRLASASFEIQGTDSFGNPLEPTTVTVDALSPSTVDVGVEPGVYTVRMLPDWILESSFEGSTFVPVDATLVSPNPLDVWVAAYEAQPVSFQFVLGKSELQIGIGVSENGQLPPGYIPDGYDGVIRPTGDGRYSIVFAGGGGACCFNTVDQAHQSYPGLELFLRP